VRSVRARVDGDAFDGSLHFSGHLTPIRGRRAHRDVAAGSPAL
jgi:hypothetical protein